MRAQILREYVENRTYHLGDEHGSQLLLGARGHQILRAAYCFNVFGEMRMTEPLLSILVELSCVQNYGFCVWTNLLLNTYFSKWTHRCK